jgi:hypothetical protein
MHEVEPPTGNMSESELDTMATKQQTKAPVKTAPPAQKGPAKSATAVAVRPANAVVDPTLAAQFEEDTGKGMANVDADSVAIPFLAVLQSNSPQCDPDSGEYNPDAKAGMFFNTVTKELFDGKVGIDIIPCEYRRTFLRWAPREAGGGFKGEFKVEEVVRMRERGQLVEMENRLYVPDDHGNVNPKVNHKVADTRVHYVLLLNPHTGVAQQAVLSLSSTQIKKSKQLISLLGNVLFERADGSKFNPATFANVVHLTTVPEIAGRVTDAATYAAAKQFHRLVGAGRAAVNFEGAAATTGDEGGDEGRF